jgi:hypothetical protein
MKNVLRNSQEVAHYWANHKQSSGSAGNVFFENDTIYSYGHHFPMARFLNNEVILFTTRSYSVTTSKHLSFTRQSIPQGIKVFHVANPCDQYSSDIVDNIVKLLSNSDQNMKMYSRACSSWKKENYYNTAASSISTAREYFTLRRKAIYDLKARKKLNQLIKAKEILFSGDKEKHGALYASIVKKEAEDARIAREARIEEQKENIAKWKNGGTNISAWRFEETYLRIKEIDGAPCVESTKGAHCTLKEAVTLWHMIQAGKPVHGVKISGYDVISYDGSTLKIGCHIIKRDEINRIGAFIDRI